LTTAGRPDGRACYQAQVHAVYALIDRLRAEHSQVEIESCAGGGGRIDAGILSRTHRVWVSDNIDPLSRLPMHDSYLQFFPPEMMGAHVGATPSHCTGSSQHIDFRAAVALPGHFGVELDLRSLGDAEHTRLTHWITRYKKWRDHIHGSEVWRGTGADSLRWLAFGQASTWLLFVYRPDYQRLRHMPDLRLPFAQDGARYAVSLLEPAERALGSFDGGWLHNQGLPIPEMKVETARVYGLVRSAVQ
ncbi:MAG: alpha-galactosidase, partial [Alphaproteobacteria bacterium]|nr:alpha-galactosidase [Alphaproteobacteria bacterium]